MSRFITPTVLLTLLIAGASALQAQTEASVRRMDQSTVRVICQVSRNTDVSGSGFVVGEGRYVVTNAHVIAQSKKQGCLVLGNGLKVRARVKGAAPEKDLALLELDSAINRPDAVFASSQVIHKAQTVFAVGFPGAADLNNLDSLLDTKITRGVISALVHDWIGNGRAETRLLETDAAINEGNSGGPLFTECAEVAGINTLKSDAPGVGWAIYIEEAYPLLERYSVPYKQTPTACQSGGQTTAVPPNMASTSEMGFVWVGTAAAILLGFTGAVAGFSSRKRARAQYAADGLTQRVSRSQPAVVKKFSLLCLEGPVAGNRYTLSGSSIALGRDPSQCKVVFPQHAEDVSRLHCRLRVSAEGAVLLEEANSSNGTFLASGERLEPLRPRGLRPNERFYLGAPNVMFQLMGEKS